MRLLVVLFVLLSLSTCSVVGVQSSRVEGHVADAFLRCSLASVLHVLRASLKAGPVDLHMRHELSLKGSGQGCVFESGTPNKHSDKVTVTSSVTWPQVLDLLYWGDARIPDSEIPENVASLDNLSPSGTSKESAGLSGAPIFASPQRGIFFKLVSEEEFKSFHALLAGLRSRMAMTRDEDMNTFHTTLARVIGGYEVRMRPHSEGVSRRVPSAMYWLVTTSVVPLGRVLFTRPSAQCDIKPHKMISIPEQAPACKQLFLHTRQSSLHHQLLPTPMSTQMLGDAALDLAMLDQANPSVIDYSWLVFFVQPRWVDQSELTAPDVPSQRTLAALGVFAKVGGSYGFLGLIDMLMRLSFGRILESVLKAARYKSFKFHNYAHKQLRLFATFFACLPLGTLWTAAQTRDMTRDQIMARITGGDGDGEVTNRCRSAVQHSWRNDDDAQWCPWPRFLPHHASGQTLVAQ